MTTAKACTGPGPNGKPCGKPEKAGGLCSGHLSQSDRGKALAPLRTRGDGSRVVLSLRVDPPVKAAALRDQDGARDALGRWARRTPKKGRG